MKKKIKHNNLLPWFTDDHGTLPASYLASCEKFFKWLEATGKSQAASAKQLTSAKLHDINRIIKENKK
jgi:site-specific recombinase